MVKRKNRDRWRVDGRGARTRKSPESTNGRCVRSGARQFVDEFSFFRSTIYEVLIYTVDLYSHRDKSLCYANKLQIFALQIQLCNPQMHQHKTRIAYAQI